MTHLRQQLREVLEEVGAVEITVIVEVKFGHQTRNAPQLNNGFQCNLPLVVCHFRTFGHNNLTQSSEVHLQRWEDTVQHGHCKLYCFKAKVTLMVQTCMVSLKCTYTHTQTLTHANTNIHTWTLMIQACMFSLKCTHTHTETHTWTVMVQACYVLTKMYTHTCTTRTHTHTHTQSTCKHNIICNHYAEDYSYE